MNDNQIVKVSGVCVDSILSINNNMNLSKYMAKKLRIEKLSFITPDDNIRYLLVCIDGWCDKIFYHGNLSKSYTLLCPIIHKTDSLCYYMNNNENWDVELDEYRNMSQIRVTVYINGIAYPSSLISGSDDMILEISYQ